MVQSILSNDAYKLLNGFDNSFLIDVRTDDEWKEYGVPELKNIIFVTYSSYDSEVFIQEILSRINNSKESKFFFICRSGKRSLISALLLENYGYKNCYNIQDGFCGSEIGVGWIKNNLPYRFT